MVDMTAGSDRLGRGARTGPTTVPLSRLWQPRSKPGRRPQNLPDALRDDVGLTRRDLGRRWWEYR